MTRAGNLLLFNLACDADDSALSFALGWIDRLAQTWERVDVITMRRGRIDPGMLPPHVHVHSVGGEVDAPDAARAASFYRQLLTLLASRRYRACFAHMMPLFAAMSAPLLRTWGVPITLWYTHRQSGTILQWATTAARWVVTAAPDSFPISTPKLCVLGHGIDTEVFAPLPALPPSPQTGPITIVYVARVMPIKRHDLLLSALALLDAELDLPALTLLLVGDTGERLTFDDDARAYVERLRTDAAALTRTQVVFTGARDRSGVIDALQSADMSINLSPPGSFDKAALEAMACALPTITAAPAFSAIMGDHAARLTLAEPTAEAIADRLRDLITLDPAARAAIGRDLRAAVVAHHGIDRLMGRLDAVLRTGTTRGDRR